MMFPKDGVALPAFALFSVVVVSAMIGVEIGEASDNMLAYPVPEFRDGWTHAAALSALNECALAAQKTNAVPLDQLKETLRLPEPDQTKPAGIDYRAAEAFDRVRSLCTSISWGRTQ